MIDTDEYIKMWNDNLLGSEGVNDLMNALIAEVKRLRKALLLIADTANGSPFVSGHMDSFVGEVLKELIE
jgi:hypothetical protein